MKTACDHFLIITSAEILRAAKYQLDLMAVRHEGTRQSERGGQEQGDHIAVTDMKGTNKGYMTGTAKRLKLNIMSEKAFGNRDRKQTWKDPLWSHSHKINSPGHHFIYLFICCCWFVCRWCLIPHRHTVKTLLNK